MNNFYFGLSVSGLHANNTYKNNNFISKIVYFNLLFFTVFSVLFSCKPKIAENIVNPYNSSKVVIDGKSVEFVKIDTDNNSFIGRLGTILISDDTFYIHDLQRNKILVYDINGSLLFSIGAENLPSPHRFGLIDDFQCNHEIKILLGREGLIYNFNKSGQFINADTLPFLARRFIQLDNGHFVFYKGRQANNNESKVYFSELLYVDNNFQLLKSHKPFDLNVGYANAYLAQSQVFLYDENSLYFYLAHEDTITHFDMNSLENLSFINVPFMPTPGEDVMLELGSLPGFVERLATSNEYPFGIFSLFNYSNAFYFTYIFKNRNYLGRFKLKNDDFLFESLQLFVRAGNKVLPMPPPLGVYNNRVYSILNAEFFVENWKSDSDPFGLNDYFSFENNPILFFFEL